MLMERIRYAFLTSSDEVVFLKLDIHERAETVDVAKRGVSSNVVQVTTFKEPWLCYSTPIAYTAELDEEQGTVPLRLALLYLLQTSTLSEWQLPQDVGPALNYAGRTRAGEKWRPAPPQFMLG